MSAELRPPPAMPRTGGVMLAVLAAVLLLWLPALWNGQPFFYPDTPTYLRGAEMGAAKVLGPRLAKPWQTQAPVSATTAAPAIAHEGVPAVRSVTSVEDKVVLAGRSVYYGALLYASHLAGSLWWAIVVHALCAAYVLHLLMVRLWGLAERHFVATAAVLAVASPLAVYTDLLMPDLFAGLGMLAAGILAVYWKRLSRPHRIALTALLLFALCSHASHVVLVGALLLVGVVARALTPRWRHLSPAAFVVVAACLAGAVVAEWAFGKAVEKTIGAPPLRLPHPMARLVDMGPGTEFLKQRCPEAGYVACEFIDHFPTAWGDFLFSPDPQKGAFALADAGGKRRMSDEQLRFVLEVLRHDPLGVVKGVTADVFRQLAAFRVDVWGYGPREFAMYEGRVPNDVYARMHSSRGAHNASYNEAFTLATYAGVLVAIALLFWLWRRTASVGTTAASDPIRFHDMAWIALTGVVANAVVCAVLASSLDRFQSRVIWIVPFLALSALALAYGRRPAVEASPSPRRPAQGAAT